MTVIFIVETLTNKMVETERLQSQMERKASKSSKRKSPKKPTGRRTGRARRAPAMDLDSDLTSSDSEGAACLPGRAQNRPRPVYDPNLIVLDCDDEFIGGPAVNFTRNVAAASAVSVEESMELKVNVRIKGEINHFHMSPVCIFSYTFIFHDFLFVGQFVNAIILSFTVSKIIRVDYTNKRKT